MFWLQGGNVYDVEKGAFRRVDIAVADQRIAAIVTAATPARDDAIIDVSGAWLLPGLIDCHVHLAMPTELADPAAAANRTDAAVALYAAKAAERTLLGG